MIVFSLVCRIYGFSECRSALSITENMLCAGGLDEVCADLPSPGGLEDQDACQGDSGGPLMVDDGKGKVRFHTLYNSTDNTDIAVCHSNVCVTAAVV